MSEMASGTGMRGTKGSQRHPPADAVSIELEVPFCDVDALQMVWHGHYFRYLDMARTALLRQRQVDAPQLAQLGVRMVVVESYCRHAFPLRYADRFTVTAWVVEVSNRIRLAYLIRNLTQDRRSALAQTVLATTDANGLPHWQIPREIRDRLWPG